ncbi:MAG: DUF2807 domain-containing protein [Pseudomonadota bacterium]
MIARPKRKLMSRADNHVLLYAALFLLCALIAAPLQAATQRVEGLEFDRVLIFGGVDVEISQGDRNELRIRDVEEGAAQPFLLDGRTLVLGRDPKRPSRDLSDIQYKLQLVNITEIGVKGSADVYIRPLTLSDLKISLAGSGEVRQFAFQGASLSLGLQGSGDIQVAEIEVEKLDVSLSGSGDVELGTIAAQQVDIALRGSGDVEAEASGKTSQLDIAVIGSGDVDLGRLDASSARVSIIGSGDALIGAAQELDVTILGSGSVIYRGSPDIKQSVIGSGDLERAR